MVLAALERGISLNNSQLAKLQERVGGNPMMAQRVIDEEYLGLEVETGDHTRYFDMTPVILIVGVVFAVSFSHLVENGARYQYPNMISRGNRRRIDRGNFPSITIEILDIERKDIG